MTSPITRITLVKIAEDKLDIALKGFGTFARNRKGVSGMSHPNHSHPCWTGRTGWKTIYSFNASWTHKRKLPSRARIYIGGKNVFKSMDDVQYYIDGRCEAHDAYRAYLKENAPPQGLMSFCFTPEHSWEMEKTS
jgi:hypothetical protein